MSTAILISGQLRTFAKCWPTQHWHVLRHFADPHFFITVQGDRNTIPSEVSALIEEYGANVHYDPRTDPDLSEHLTPQLTRAFHQAPYANAAPAHQLLLQHWYQQEVWKFFQSVSRGGAENAEQTHLRASAPPREPKFDTIIRLRADLWFHSFDYPYATEHAPAADECLTPWWGRFGGINDRLAIMGPRAARYYFGVFDNLDELIESGCPFHPETLVAANLERGNIEVRPTLRTEFSTLRTNGDMRWPEINGVDIAHAALRAA